MPSIGFFAAAWKLLRSIPWQAIVAVVLIAGVWFYGNSRYDAGRDDEAAKRDAIVAAAVLKAVEAEREAQAAHDTREAARHTHTQELREAAQAAPEGRKSRAVIEAIRKQQQ